MSSRALAEAVTHLPWVPPSAASLVALARPHTPATWLLLREDPGAVLLLLRTPSVRRLPPDHFSLPDLIGAPEVLESAAAHLGREGEGRLPDWSVPGRAAVLEACLRYARSAHRLARHVPGCDPDKAWVAGLLAPLGWLALAIYSPREVVECLAAPSFTADAQHERWGLDQAETARRLARRWSLPSWLAAVAGHLALPADVAEGLGADPLLFRVTQLAAGLVQQQGKGLLLPVGATVTELLASLGISSPRAADLPEEDEEEAGEGPAGPLSLVDLLALAAENRRLRAARGGRLEEELDVLHRALAEQRGREDERLRQQKLSALAEFAAGAGHEINNPLAVISGQAQYLLGHEEAPERRRALETIVGQAQRIHQLLRDVMQFARPPAPNRRPVDLARLVDEVGVSLTEYAGGRKVKLLVREAAGANVLAAAVMVAADAAQLRTALTCLLRNAVEAAPAEGWASVRVEVGEGRVEVFVENSGAELSADHREHLFDPFYSGRSAGRGTGLGLPTAWSLARQQGGDVSLASQAGEPTRFVLRLPLAASPVAALAG